MSSLTAALPSRAPVVPWLRVAVLAGAAWIVAYSAATAFARSQQEQNLVADGAYLVPIAFAVGLSVLAALRTHGRKKRFWALLAVSNVLWLAGEVTWSVYELVLGRESPFPSAADAFYVASYAAVPIAILGAFGGTSLRTVWRSVVDASVVVAVFGLAGWTLLIGPQLEWGMSLATATGIAYPLLGLLILMLLASVGVLGSGGTPPSIVVVGVAFTVSALTDTAYTYLAVLHDVIDGKWLSIGWQVEAVLLCIAAAAALRRERGRIVRGARERGLALVLAGGVAAVLVVALDALHGELSTPSLALGVFAVGAVLIRLYTTSKEKEKLATRLEAALTEKQALVRELQERNDALSEHSALLTQSLALREQVERERAQLEEQLRHSQKLEAVGKLAGGIAHEFNNLLTAIGGYAQLLEDRLVGVEQTDAREIRVAAERASALTHQLLAFGRKQVLQPTRVDLNSVVDELQTLLRPLLGDDVVLELRRTDEPSWVDIDVPQLQQALVNLALNARDAMPSGGTFAIGVSEMDLFSDSSRSGLSVGRGRYACLTVSDTGIGMDDDTRLHVFEPFFTTKPDGGGLGLASVYGIVRQSGGDLRIESRPGAGTTFEIFLPVSRNAPALAVVPKPIASRTVLLVDDERVVRSFLRRVLEGLGWTVVEARAGDEALALAAEHDVELLLTDVVMPGMSGSELADAVRRIRPELRTIFMSGHNDDDVVRRGGLGNSTQFLQKPFGERELVTALEA